MKKYMVIEKFKPGLMEKAYDLFHRDGRKLPEGLFYLNSWVNSEHNICFQLMETNDEHLFQEWFKRWEKYVDFELYPID